MPSMWSVTHDLIDPSLICFFLFHKLKIPTMYMQQKKTVKGKERASPTTATGGGGSRRLLSGLGSFPPRCTSKCGRCVPCKPVHVPVPPGTPVTAEYYPEAWRCKCGNKYYMP
ncbi:hypothetical protein DM860_000056 [Cuscuta australis]|uniref:Epidermal patterning factor-like protein n=1 Tax=Cuscuta australis TaxID=267555 RepID=A0A328CVK7_9ASTE|nr:hypothetical protein DM860_000056 [Cuscuta australis]